MKNTLTIDTNNTCSCDCLDYVNDGSNSIYLIVIVGNVTSPKLTLDGVTKALDANTSNIVEISTAKFVANATITFNYSDETHTGNTFKITFPNKLEGNLTIKRVDNFNYNAKYTKIGSDGSTTVTVKVNSTTTGAPGTDAQVTNSGTDENVRLNFIIPRGDKGDQGPLGPQGLQGEQGPGGPIGPPGDKGEKGESGDKGAKGDKGDTGPQGEQGPQGIQGEPGKDGTSVSVKSVSESSADGGSNVVTFTDGKTVTIKNDSKGSTGSPGKDGTNGKDGEKGATGATGPQGPQGPKGDTGPQGEKGATGANGKDGAAGAKGDTGLTALEFKYVNGSPTTTLGDTRTLNIYSFNRTPVVGDTFLMLDTNSNLCIWQVTKCPNDDNPAELTVQLMSYRSVKGDTGPQGPRGSDATVTVDSALSTSSTNPVQNKVITARLNEVFQSVSDGKSLVASAITDKGVTTAADATFQTMATNIANIPSGSGGGQEVVFNEYTSATTINIKKDTYQGKTLKQIIIMYCSYYLKTNYGAGTARATLTANTDASEYMTQLFVKNCGSARPSSTGNMNIPSFTAYEIADETPLDTLLCTVTLTSMKVRNSSSGTTTIKSHAYIYKIYE